MGVRGRGLAENKKHSSGLGDENAKRNPALHETFTVTDKCSSPEGFSLKQLLPSGAMEFRGRGSLGSSSQKGIALKVGLVPPSKDWR